MNLKAKKVPEVPGKLWSDAEFSGLMKTHPRTLAQWRYLGKYQKELPYIKIGKMVRYTDEVVARFLASHMSGVMDQE